MGRSLKPEYVKEYTLDLRRCKVYSLEVKPNSKTASKVYLPAGLKGKSVHVVVIDG